MLTSRKLNSVPSSAEQRFREAFERLKNDKPIVLPKGTPVSQNNVAKEASCDPSALRKVRFPLLILDIQSWITENKTKPVESERQKMLKRRQKNRDTKTRIMDLKRQRDNVQGLLNDAQLQIIELIGEVKMLRAALDELRPLAKIHKTIPKSNLGMDMD